MIKQYNIRNKQKPDFNGLILIGIQAYKENNPFGIEFIKFYELRDYKGHTSHHFIKCIKTNDINREIKNILKEMGIKK